MLNMALLKSPYNWATVAIMAMFGLLLLSILFPQSDNS